MLLIKPIQPQPGSPVESAGALPIPGDCDTDHPFGYERFVVNKSVSPCSENEGEKIHEGTEFLTSVSGNHGRICQDFRQALFCKRLRTMRL
jgi:hypothetical protein